MGGGIKRGERQGKKDKSEVTMASDRVDSELPSSRFSVFKLVYVCSYSEVMGTAV